MTLLLDAGAFLAFERGDRRIEAAIRSERRADRSPRTHGGVVGQVFRSARQVPLVRLLKTVETIPLGIGLGRDAGRLLAASGTSDVIDAALIALAEDGDEIITSDPVDLRRLAVAAGVHLRVLPL